MWTDYTHSLMILTLVFATVALFIGWVLGNGDQTFLGVNMTGYLFNAGILYLASIAFGVSTMVEKKYEEDNGRGKKKMKK